VAEGREESEQLPEEGPAEQVVNEAGDGARDEAERSPGGADDEERATGHPQHEDEEEPSGTAPGE
jgi:hypothetical protein